MFSVPPDPKSLSLDAFMNDQRFAKFLINRRSRRRSHPRVAQKKSPDDAGGGASATRTKKVKMGKKSLRTKPDSMPSRDPRTTPISTLPSSFADRRCAESRRAGHPEGDTQGRS